MKNKKLKVLFIAPIPPPYGGIANWFLMMKEYMNNRDDAIMVDVVNIAPTKRDLDGRTLWDRVVGQGKQMFKLNVELKKKIKEKTPNVIHMTTSGRLAIIRDILFLKTAKKFNVPVVYHIRYGRIPEISKKNTFEWKILSKAINLSTKTIVIDGFSYDSLLEYFENDKIVKLPNPFDLDKKRISVECDNANDNKFITFIGWCIKEKGIEELLEAWDEVSPQYSDWKLQLIGPFDKQYKEKILKKFNMKNVLIEGEQGHEEVMKKMACSSIFILPSYTEGFPNAVLEAMSAKKAIIATSVGAIPDMLEDNCGLVIPKQNKSEIVNSLIKLINNERLRVELGENAYNKLVTQYSLDIVYSRYWETWKEIS